MCGFGSFGTSSSLFTNVNPTSGYSGPVPPTSGVGSFGTSSSLFTNVNPTSGYSGPVPPTSGGSGLLPFSTASFTSPFAAPPSALFFGHQPAPITSAFGTNTTMPGFWPSIPGCQSHALVLPGYMFVGLVPVYSPNPYVFPQAAPTVGNQQGNEGVSSGIAAGFNNPFIISVPPPTTSTINTFPWSSSQLHPNNNPPPTISTPNTFRCSFCQPQPNNNPPPTTSTPTFPSSFSQPQPNNNPTASVAPSNSVSVVPGAGQPTGFQFTPRTEPTVEKTPTFSLFGPPRETTTGGTPACFQFPPRTETTTGGTPACSPFPPQKEAITEGTPACFRFPPCPEAITEGTPAGFRFPPLTEALTGGIFPPCTHFPPRTETTTGGPLSFAFTPESSIFGKTMISPYTHNPFSSHYASSVEGRCDERPSYEYPSIQRGGGSRSSIFTPTSEEGGFGTIHSISVCHLLVFSGGSFPPRPIASSSIFGG